MSFNRGTGVLIIHVVNSNPNGDPDREGDPRTFDDGRGLISPVSFKRKLRDLMEAKGPSLAGYYTRQGGDRKFDILESRGRDRRAIARMDRAAFVASWWDARVFGSTFLEKGDEGRFISTGVVQFGPGVSVAPVDIVRLSLTNRAGVQPDRDRGSAPLAMRFVRHGLYVMPFFVNPMAAAKSGCDARDIDLMLFLISYAYSLNASAIRPQVEILHAFYAEHRTPLGSCPDSLLINALTPRKLERPHEPSTSLADYIIPDNLPPQLAERLASFDNLCMRSPPSVIAA